MGINILLNYLAVENSIHFERKDTFQSIPSFIEMFLKIKIKLNDLDINLHWTKFSLPFIFERFTLYINLLQTKFSLIFERFTA